ncbi:Caltractin [Symbiodinium natans]|uniref:Caltractin protein n=1 Tax=Symbiodinium natans TaxID=878477 RepID=A0A812KV10_9DINO|nr:Caltractin [Symbiodinium natans]
MMLAEALTPQQHILELEKPELSVLYDLVDTDGSGRIDDQERKALQAMTTRDGQREFLNLAHAVSRHHRPSSILVKAFSLFVQSGKISTTKIRDLAEELLDKLFWEEDIHVAFSIIDVNGSGCIDSSELSKASKVMPISNVSEFMLHARGQQLDFSQFSKLLAKQRVSRNVLKLLAKELQGRQISDEDLNLAIAAARRKEQLDAERINAEEIEAMKHSVL